MPSDPPLLRVTHAHIRHEGSTQNTPDDVSFEVAAGEVVLLLGPSGSGKSTLALALNGLVPHAVPAELAGTIEVGGIRSTETTVAELSAQVSMVFQDPDAQIVTGTLLDEVCFGPENLLLPIEEVLARAEAALRRVGLWERRSENPDRLSGGGRQRLAIACALALRSPLIVLDEPTANLDPAGIEEVYAVLGELVRDGGHAIVLIEHNLDAAIALVDRVMVIGRDGRLALDGTPDTVLRGQVDALMRMGVWLPTATLAGLRLRAAGHEVPVLPLTPGDLTAVLDGIRPAGAGGPVRPSPPGAGEEPAHGAEPEGTGTAASAGTETETATTTAVRVRDLRVTKGRGAARTEVLHGIDLELPAGSFTAIVGTNGAGKTTLLQAIAGVAAPPRGTVEVLGLDPSRADARALARRVGFVFQNPEHQFIRGTVAEELAHGLELQHLDRADIDAQVDRMLDRFGLGAQRGEHPFLLSGGQKRRLSVGTALIAGAPVLALDEPTFGQDRERATHLLDILKQLNDEGRTVVVVTHDLQLVADYASHVVVMAEGRVRAHDLTGVILGSDALETAGLLAPPLVRALRSTADPAWHALSRLSDLGPEPESASGASGAAPHDDDDSTR